MADHARATPQPLDALKGWTRNPRRISQDAAAGLRYSLERFGDLSGFTFNRGNGQMIAGHQRKAEIARLIELRDAQVTLVEPDDDGSPEQWGHIEVASYEHPELGTIPPRRWPVRFVRWGEHDHALAALAANNPEIAGENTDDYKGLIKELEEGEEAAVKALLLSLDPEQGPAQAPTKERGPQEPGDGSEPSAVERWGVKKGQIWSMGPHRMYVGDCRDRAAVERMIGAAMIGLISADPPYGMDKDDEGVANDDLKGAELDRFQMEWITVALEVCCEDLSLYVWGEAPKLWRLWYVGDAGGLGALQEAGGGLLLKNEIVWAKGSAGAGGVSFKGQEDLRSYPGETERCLFVMRGEQEIPNNAGDYWEGWEPIRAYLDAERERMGWGPADTKRITGTYMHSHWFTRSQWTYPRREHYEALREAAAGAAFGRTWEEMEAEAAPIREAYRLHLAAFYAGRAFFDNTHQLMTDVWDFSPVKGDDRWGHPTPKPVDLVRRVLRSSSPPGGAVFVPFLGSGSDIEAAEREGRRIFGCELLPKWAAVILDRAVSLGLTPALWEAPGEGKPSRG